LDLFGLEVLALAWHVLVNARAKLDSYVVLRGQIAHRLKHVTTVYKNLSADYLNHVERLVTITQVSEHFLGCLGTTPW